MMDAARYRPDVDGLRAVAVGAVVAFHAFPGLAPGGFVGVDVFFVISGYLISGIILDALRERRFTFAGFYARRIRRIFPSLTLMLATLLAVGWFVLGAQGYRAVSRHVIAGAAFASNIVLWRESGYFDTAAELKPLLHLWSLGIEEQFYLVWPVLLVIAGRWRRGPLAVVTLMALASLAASLAIVNVNPMAAFYAPWFRFWELLAGAWLAAMEADASAAPGLKRWVGRQGIADACSAGGIAAILAGVFLVDGTRAFPGWWALLPVAGTWLTLLAGRPALINRSLLSWRPLVGVGLISYPLYLWHWPMLVLDRILFGAPSVAVRLTTVAASVALAWATYRAVEHPLRFGSLRRHAVPVLAAAMALVAAVGASVYVSNGFPERAFARGTAATFIEYYDHLRTERIAGDYHAECDFLDWRTYASRASIDPSCVARGRDRTLLLWGDSFAQALSRGIREQLDAGTALAQVATSACRPEFASFEGGPDGRCERSNRHALDQITALQPALVIVAQKADHSATDWAGLAAAIQRRGAGGVIVVGPSPRWEPTLPVVFANNYLVEPRAYVELGLDRTRVETDRRLEAALANLPGLTYVSLIAHLCRPDGCLAQVPDAGPLDLMAFDAGHFTPLGSSYVGRAVLKPYLDRSGR